MIGEKIDEAITVLEEVPVGNLSEAGRFRQCDIDGNIVCQCPAMILIDHFNIEPEATTVGLIELGTLLTGQKKDAYYWTWTHIAGPYDDAFDDAAKNNPHAPHTPEWWTYAKNAGRKATIDALREGKKELMA